ncbi:MAG: helix-turn-helix transcriptional regulator [Syntrophobacteraceae bacterium]
MARENAATHMLLPGQKGANFMPAVWSDSVVRGARFRAVRESAKLNKREFAKEIGVSPAYITYLENGEKSGSPVIPTDTIYQLIAHRFGVSPRWLKEGVGQMHSSLRQAALGVVWSVPDDKLPEFIEYIKMFPRNGTGRD